MAGNRSEYNDEENKLKQYMIINKQISKTLSVQRIEIAKLKLDLKDSTSQNIALEIENHKWKKKCFELRKMYVDHMQSIYGEFQKNAAKITNLSDNGFGEDELQIFDLSIDQSAARRKSASKRNDRSRISKSFESASKRSSRQHDVSVIHTIAEESEDDSSLEITVKPNEESDADSSCALEITAKTNGESDAESSLEITAKTNEESDAESTLELDTNMNGENGAGEDDGNFDETVKEEEGTDDESDDSEEESDDIEEESEEGSEYVGNESSEDESDDTDVEESIKGLNNSMASQNGTEIDNGNQSASISDEENDSSIVERITLLTATLESPIRNDDSRMENDRSTTIDDSTSTQSKREKRQSIVDKSFNKSTTLKSSNKLQSSRKAVNNSQNEKGEDLTFGSTKSLVSSTPYRNSNVVSMEISSPASSTRSKSSKSNISKTVVSLGSQLSISSGSRPKRKAAPVVLSEPKLNTKLRRPQ